MIPRLSEYYQRVQDFLDRSDAYIDYWEDDQNYAGWKPFELSPGDFLEFAESDLQSSLPHRYVNALANIKRAIDCQLDCVLDAFGLLKTARSQRWGFPRKLEIVQSIGFLTPPILRRINRSRNLLEHKFEQATAEAVEDALDMAKMFVAYVDGVSRIFPTYAICMLELEPELESKKHEECLKKRDSGEFQGKFRGLSYVEFKLDGESKTLQIESFLQGEIEKATFGPNDEDFLAFIGLLRRMTPYTR